MHGVIVCRGQARNEAGASEEHDIVVKQTAGALSFLDWKYAYAIEKLDITMTVTTPEGVQVYTGIKDMWRYQLNEHVLFELENTGGLQFFIPVPNTLEKMCIYVLGLFGY